MNWVLIAEGLALLQIAAAVATGLAVLLDRRMRASSAMSWLLLVFVVPGFGVVLYLLAGKPWMSHGRRHRHALLRKRLANEMCERMAVRVTGVRAALARMPDGTRSLAILAGQISGHPPFAGNEVEFEADTPDLMDRLVGDIDRATDHVHILFYIALDDEGGRPVMEAMMRAAKRGIQVRFMADAIGSRTFLKSPTRRKLEAAGVRVVPALPGGVLRAFFERIDLRNHRKIVVIDNRIGYIGSHNLASATFKVKRRFAPWVDATCRIEGLAVQSLQRVFIEDWWAETEEDGLGRFIDSPQPVEGGVVAQVVATGPTSEENSMPQVIATCVHLAQRELVLTTPYFVPDEATLLAIITAAKRGVRVVLVVPEHNDSTLVKLASRSFFQRLLDSGVELLEFRGGMLHAKTIVVDGRLGVMTSSNLDRRSFEINFEVSLLLYDEAAAKALRRLQQSYIERGQAISARHWADRPWWTRLVENAVGLASPVL